MGVVASSLAKSSICGELEPSNFIPPSAPVRVPTRKPDTSKKPESMPASSSTSAAAQSKSESSTKDESDKKIAGFGNTNSPTNVCDAQWLMLWTHAAYIPANASDEQKVATKIFFEGVMDQCKGYGFDGVWDTMIKKIPPRTGSRRECMLWLCTIENACRKAAGMPLKKCMGSSLENRWRYEDGYL